MRRTQSHQFFHAGLFLQAELAKSGHDVAWLAAQAGREPGFITSLLTQPIMDAELFVGVGSHLGAPFFASLEALIFRESKEMDA